MSEHAGPGHSDAAPRGPSEDLDAEARIPSRSTSARLWKWALVTSCLVAIASWIVGETRLVQVVPRRGHFSAAGKTVEGISTQERDLASVTSEARIHTVIGATLGLTMGLLGAFHRRTGPGTLLVIAAAGTICGLFAGCAVSLGILPRAGEWTQAATNETLVAVLLKGTIWALLGAAGGLALGLGLGGWRQICLCLASGLAGGVLGAIGYEILAGLFFPLETTGALIPSAALPRFLSILFGTVAIADTAAASQFLLPNGAESERARL